MKKLYILSALLLLTTFSFAQTFNWGVKAGINLSTIHGITSQTGFNNNLAGFTAGIIADVGFSDFSIQPGLFYTTKGQQVQVITEDANQQNIKSSAASNRLNYLELPVNFLFNIVHLPGGNIHLGAGPYIGYGISEVATIEETTYHPKFSDNYKNPDYGVNLIAGTKLLKHFLIDFQYSYGIANLGPYSSNVNNRVWSLSAGYLFR
jgi:Outer membrane protein beta-barrel domain